MVKRIVRCGKTLSEGNSSRTDLQLGRSLKTYSSLGPIHQIEGDRETKREDVLETDFHLSDLGTGAVA